MKTGRIRVATLALLFLGAFDVDAESLHEAVALGDRVALRDVLATGADIDARDAIGGTALHLASERGDLDLVVLLLESGASIKARDGAGLTPLHLAARSGNAELVDSLLANCAPREARDHRRATPLHFAAAAGRLDVVRVLLDNGADHTAQQVGGSTPLSLAWNYGREEVVALLSGRSELSPAGPAQRTQLRGRALVRHAQELLAASGLKPGPADGRMGSQTRASIRRYQQQIGQVQTGEPNICLVEKLEAGIR